MTTVNNEKTVENKLHTEMKFSVWKCLFLFIISFIWVKKVITGRSKAGHGYYAVEERTIYVKCAKWDIDYPWTMLHERIHAGQHLLSVLGLHKQFRNRFDSLNMLYIELEADYLNTLLSVFGNKYKDEIDSMVYWSVAKAEDYRHGACAYKHMDIKPSEVCKAYFPKTYSKSETLRDKLKEEDEGFKSIISDTDLLYIIRRLLGII